MPKEMPRWRMMPMENQKIAATVRRIKSAHLGGFISFPSLSRQAEQGKRVYYGAVLGSKRNSD